MSEKEVVKWGVCMCVCTCSYVYNHVCVYTCYMFKHVFVCTYVCTCVWIYTCLCTHVCVHLYFCKFVCFVHFVYFTHERCSIFLHRIEMLASRYARLYVCVITCAPSLRSWHVRVCISMYTLVSLVYVFVVMWGSRKSSSVRPLIDEIRQCQNSHDGKSLCKILKTHPALTSKQISQCVGGAEYLFFYLSYHPVGGEPVANLESLVKCFRLLVGEYVEKNDWLLPVFMHVCVVCRTVASKMGPKWEKTIIEVFREVFPILHKDESKFTATCWLVSQMLSLYMRMDQVALCGPLLLALTQSSEKRGFDFTTGLPKSISVTLFFHWGKFLLFESKYSEAYSRLEWAFANSTMHVENARRIAEYLIPCAIHLDTPPPVNTNAHFSKLIRAIQAGNIDQFDAILQRNSQHFAKSGTLILIEKSKLICIRNWLKRCIHIIQKLNDPETDDTSKLDLRVLEAAFTQKTDRTKNDLICSLADLIYAGAIKGYIALEHDKLVLSKVNPFPKIDS